MMSEQATTGRRIDSTSVGDPDRHLDLETLERGLAALPPAPKDRGRVALLVRRGEGGVRETLDAADLTPEEGLVGDRWGSKPGRSPDTQLTVVQADVARLVANGQPLALWGDQLFLELDLSRDNLPTGTRVQVGEAVLVVTPVPHDGCRKFKARFGTAALRLVSGTDLRHLNLRGVYMRVLEGGRVAVGDGVEVVRSGSEAPSP